MNTNKIERAAVRVVEDYIDKCPKLEPYITSNDKTPIWDGYIYIYLMTDTLILFTNSKIEWILLSKIVQSLFPSILSINVS